MSYDRNESRKYEADVEYEVWRRGGNPDRVDRDRVDDYLYRGLRYDEAATREITRQRRRQEPAPEVTKIETEDAPEPEDTPVLESGAQGKAGQ